MRKNRKKFKDRCLRTCQAVEQLNGEVYRTDLDPWRKKASGWLRINVAQYILSLHNGNVFEKVGVNYVKIELPSGMTFQVRCPCDSRNRSDAWWPRHPYFTTGTSFDIHPYSQWYLSCQLSLFPDRWCINQVTGGLAVQISHQYLLRKMQFISIRCIKFATNTIPPITTL